MRSIRRTARINVKAVVLLLAISGVLCGAALGGHYLRKRVMAARALEEGNAALARGDWPEACTQLRRYLERHPEDPEILEKFGYAQLAVRPRETGNISAAIGVFRRLLRLRPGDDRFSDELARLFMGVGEYDEAVRFCKSRLGFDPTDASATVLLGAALINQDRPDEAVDVLTPLVEKHHPDELDAYLLLSRIAEREDRLEDALGWLDLSVENNPESPHALAHRARLYLDGKKKYDVGRRDPVAIEADLESARQDLLAAEALQPEDPNLQLLMAGEWVRLNELDRARVHLAGAEHPTAEFFEQHHIDPDNFALQWFIVSGDLARRLDHPAELTSIAKHGLDELQGNYRSAFLPTAINLYLAAGRIDQAEQILQDYRTIVHQKLKDTSAADASLELLSARVAFANGRTYDAINFLEPIVEREPRNVSAWRLLSQAYVGTRQNRRAIVALMECVERAPGDVAATMQLVKEYLRQRNWPKALQYARTCEPLDQKNLEVKLLRIEATLRAAMSNIATTGTLQHLAAELDILRDRYPQVPEVRMLQAAIAEHNDDFETAIQELQLAIDECKETVEASVQLSGVLIRAGRPDKALEVLLEATERRGDVARPWTRWAEQLARDDLLDEAQDVLSNALDKVEGAQERREVLLARVRIDLSTGSRESAIETLRKIAEEEPQDVWSRIALLELPEILEDTPSSQELVDELKRIEGERSGLHWRLHQVRVWLRESGTRAHQQEIVDALTHCLETDPGWSRPVLILGSLHQRLQDADQAEQIYRAYLEVNPTTIEVVDKYLGLLESQERYEEAKAVLDRYDQENRELAVAPGTRSRLSAHRIGLAIRDDAFDSAISELRLRVAANPNDANARMLLARLIYRELGDADQAFDLLNEASRIAPESPTITAVRVAILMAENQQEQALAVLDETVVTRDDFSSYLLRAEFHIALGASDLAEADYRRLIEFENSAAFGYELLGRFLRRQGRGDEAIEAWERGSSVDPNRLSLKRLMVRALLLHEQEEKRRRGAELLDTLLADQPNDADLLGIRVTLLLQKKTEEAARDAETILERIVRLDPRDARAHVTLIRIAMEKRDLDAAADHTARALGSVPRNEAVLLASAELESARGNLTRASELARLALDSGTKRVEIHLFLVDMALAANRLDEAKELIELAVQLAPNNESVLLKKAAVLNADDRRSEAVTLLANFVETEAGQRSPAVAITLAELYCKSEQDLEFERHIARAERLVPDNAAITRVRLSCLASRGRFDEIDPLLSEHQADHPRDTYTLLIGAMLLASSQEHLTSARAIFERVLEIDPANVDGRLGIAQVAYVNGDRLTAQDEYRKVLELDPTQRQALNDLAWMLAEDEQLEQAVQFADRGIKAHPDDPHLLDTRGVVLTKLGRLSAAERDLTSSAAIAELQNLWGTQTRALIHLARVLVKRGDASDARTKLLEAIDLDRRHELLTGDERDEMNELFETL